MGVVPMGEFPKLSDVPNQPGPSVIACKLAGGSSMHSSHHAQQPSDGSQGFDSLHISAVDHTRGRTEVSDLPTSFRQAVWLAKCGVFSMQTIRS